MSVGEVAGRLGVAPSTVRMWGSRYGLTASARSAGGHRRYSADDVDRLVRMQAAVLAGSDPAAAAATVLSSEQPARSLSRRGGPGGSVLAVPGAGPDVRGLARAASRLDELGLTDAVVAALRERGTVDTWNQILRPVLVAAGEHWQRTGTGIEVEHLLTQAVTTAFAQYTAFLPEVAQENPVVLAGSPHEDHVLALHAVRAGLAERGVPVRFLGPRTPMSALAATGTAHPGACRPDLDEPVRYFRCKQISRRCVRRIADWSCWWAARAGPDWTPGPRQFARVLTRRSQRWHRRGQPPASG